MATVPVTLSLPSAFTDLPFTATAPHDLTDRAVQALFPPIANFNPIPSIRRDEFDRATALALFYACIGREQTSWPPQNNDDYCATARELALWTVGGAVIECASGVRILFDGNQPNWETKHQIGNWVWPVLWDTLRKPILIRFPDDLRFSLIRLFAPQFHTGARALGSPYTTFEIAELWDGRWGYEIPDTHTHYVCHIRRDQIVAGKNALQNLPEDVRKTIYAIGTFAKPHRLAALEIAKKP